MAGQQGVASMAVTKTALTAAALGVAAYSRVLGRRVSGETQMPVASGTRVDIASDGSPDAQGAGHPEVCGPLRSGEGDDPGAVRDQVPAAVRPTVVRRVQELEVDHQDGRSTKRARGRGDADDVGPVLSAVQD